MVQLELSAERLRKFCDYTQFEFETTEQLHPLEGIVGQERAVKAMEFGLLIKSPGYNIFMAGLTGTGKTTYARTLVHHVAKTEEIPDDWCYVYNFERLGQPITLNLPPGMGKEFAQDMEELIEDLLAEIPKAFDGEDYERQRNFILMKFQDESGQLMDQLTKAAEDMGFTLKRTSTGFVSVPVIEGHPLSPSEYEALDESIAKEFDEKSVVLQERTLEIMRRVRQAEKETKDKIKELDNQVGLFAVGHLIDDLREKYRAFSQIINYLNCVQVDILAHLDNFRPQEEDPNQIPWLKPPGKDPLRKYKVNLFIDNSQTEGAPVVIETNPSYYNLLGRVEYKNELGVMTTDFTRIKAGSLHKANGGYLIIQVKDVVSSPYAWEALKRVLKTEELRIENLGDQLGAVAVATLKPAGIPVNVKVVLIGNAQLYKLLYHYDEDFRKLFKIKSDFDSEMNRNRDNMTSMAAFISSICEKQGIKHFDRTGVAQIVEYSSRLADHQDKLTTRFNEIVEIVYEADAWSSITGDPYISGEHVKKAIAEKSYRSNKYEVKIQELIDTGVIMVDTQGAVVGQLNGLSILNLGDYEFGRPSRITAVTYLGQRGVINIEREVQISGTSHSKGIMILSGYLGAKYAQEIPLSLTASLTFEQLYEGVDGDSASSTELYAIMSSLAGLPIQQGIAVTGSVNQRGEIQPVGGVTHKVEGFYVVCKQRGLTGKQGVMIPHQNVANLMLSEEVVDAVKEGKFHIYAVETIDQGIEILTGVPAGARDKRGKFPKGTVNYLIQEKLEKYARAMLTFVKEAKKGSRTRKSTKSTV
ncbi:MAG: Lon protease family protein [Thermincolia bacterium]